jgi:hypothetical protein
MSNAFAATRSPSVSETLSPPELPALIASSDPEKFLSSLRGGSPISLDVMSQIPRQVLSARGHPGDVTNFLVIGSKHDMKKAMDAAGWDTVASTKIGVIWRDMFESLYAKAYRGIPMTKLYLYGRQQDFGYAHSRGLLSVRNRHHFRIWKAPFEIDGQTVWVGAATHDVALHHEGHFLHLIHKIDPNVDAERQFISNTLIKTGRVITRGYVTAPGALTKARTIEGEDFYTDGRTLVLQLVGTPPKKSAGLQLAGIPLTAATRGEEAVNDLSATGALLAQAILRR